MGKTGGARRIWAIAACDFRLTWKDRSNIIWTLLMPLAFIFVFGQIQYGGSPSDVKAALTIEDNDKGPVSKALIASLSRENLALVTELKEGQEAVRTLVIPVDFSRKALSREKTRLVMRKKEGTNVEAGQAAEVAVFRGMIKTVSALLEIENGVIREGGGSLTIEGDTLSGSLQRYIESRPEALAAIGTELDSIVARAPVAAVSPSFAGKARDIPGGFQSSVPGNLVMFVLMGMAFSGIAITQERKAGLLARTAASPAGKREIVLGKLAGRMMVGMIQILVLLLAGRFLFGISLGSDIPALVVLMAAFAFCCGSFSILFGSLFGNPDQMTGFAIITTLVMSALGGSWWPLEVMPQPFRVVAFCIPTGWTMDGIHKLISFGYGFGSVALHIAVLLLFGAAFLAVASARLKLER